MVIMLFVFSRYIDRRPMLDLGLRINREWWFDLAAGLVIGAFSLTAVALLENGLGWAEFKLIPQNSLNTPIFVTALLALLNLTAVGFGEELTFRGYQLTNLAEGYAKRAGRKKAIIIALSLTSAFFGVAHLLNPNAGLLPTLNITLAGLLFGLAYVWSGSLALPLGIHIAWGYFEEFIYGYANSGQAPFNSLMTNTVTGPELWTGGAFGPEGGLLILLLLLLDIGLVSIWINSRKRWKGIHVSLADYPKKMMWSDCFLGKPNSSRFNTLFYFVFCTIEMVFSRMFTVVSR
jgi:membrane protease YdiL (CAAX protease family)